MVGPATTIRSHACATWTPTGSTRPSSYCEVSAFRYLYLVENGAAEATRAFNTALAEFASADPKRLVVAYQIPIHDVDMAIDEVRWAAANGCKSLQLPVFPAELGLPDYWDTRYDPLWTAIQEVDLPLCLHIGLKLGLEDVIQRDPTPQRGIFIPMVSLTTAEALGMWVLTGVLERHPAPQARLRGAGHRLGHVVALHRRRHGRPPGLRVPRRSPSCRASTSTATSTSRSSTNPTSIRAAHESLGIENIMWSSDYPHPVGSWPNSRATVERIFAGESDDDRDLVCSGNAARVWNL